MHFHFGLLGVGASLLHDTLSLFGFLRRGGLQGSSLRCGEFGRQDMNLTASVSTGQATVNQFSRSSWRTLEARCGERFLPLGLRKRLVLGLSLILSHDQPARETALSERLDFLPLWPCLGLIPSILAKKGGEGSIILSTRRRAPWPFSKGSSHPSDSTEGSFRGWALKPKSGGWTLTGPRLCPLLLVKLGRWC